MIIEAKKKEYNQAYQALQQEKQKLQLLLSTKEQTLNVVTDITKAVNAKAFESEEEKQKALELRELGKIGLNNIAKELPRVQAAVPKLQAKADQLYQELEQLKKEELAFQKQHNAASASFEGTTFHEHIVKLETDIPKRLEIYTEKGFNLKLLPFQRSHTFVVDKTLTGDILKVVLLYEGDKSQIYRLKLPSSLNLIELKMTFEFKYGDGEKEFPILINGYASEASGEGGDSSYWDHYLLNVVEDETGMDREDMLYLDGDKDGDILSENAHFHLRMEKGKAAAHEYAPLLLERLAKNEEGKIIQRIQVYTHSRGGAYGNAFSDELLVIFQGKYADRFADPNNIFDAIVNLDLHQSKNHVVEDHTFPVLDISHFGSGLGDNYGKGDMISIETSKWIGDNASHANATFTEELEQVLYQHNTNTIEGNDKYEGFEGLLEDERTFKGVEQNKKARENYDPDEMMIDTNFGDVF